MKINLMKLIKNPRFLDIFCYVFCAIYLFCAICVAGINVYEGKKMDAEINNLLAYVNSINKQVEKENLFNKENENPDLPSTPLFSDGKTALITAYKKLYDANSFYIKLDGQISTSVMDIALKVRFCDTAIRYNSQKCFNELLIGFIDSSALQSTISEKVKYGKQILKEGDSCRFRDTIYTDVVDNTLVGYGWSAVSACENVSIMPEKLLIVNEETIRQISYFKVKTKDGRAQYYYVQAELDPEKATKDFATATSFNLGLCQLGIPTYTRCTITACINANGNLLGLTSSDTADLSVTYSSLNLQVKANYNITYAFNAIDQQINFVPEGF